MDMPLAEIQSRFAARPWSALDPAVLAAAAAVPTMLGPEEQALYAWLARDWATGAGEIVDLGAFAGGSTARLAAGLAAAGRPGLVHAFDRFTADAENRARHLYPFGIPPQDGDDILPVVHHLLAPWERQVTFHVGDILEKRWRGGPIELLVVDIAKSAAAADHVAAEFFPALIPGRSVVVQQDFALRVTPWLPAQMALLARHFVPLVHCRPDSLAFLCIAPVTRAEARAAAIAGRDDAALEVQIRQAGRLFAGHVPRHRFSEQIRALRANPGQRRAWDLRRRR